MSKNNKKKMLIVERKQVTYDNLSTVPDYSTIKLTYFDSIKKKYIEKIGTLNDVFWYNDCHIIRIATLNIDNRRFFFFDETTMIKSFYEILKYNKLESPINIQESSFDHSNYLVALNEDEEKRNPKKIKISYNYDSDNCNAFTGYI